MMEVEVLAIGKWVVFALACAGVIPLALWLRRNPGHAPVVWTVMGLMPFFLTVRPGFDISLLSWAQEWPNGSYTWPGYVKGVQISALDLLALAVYLSLPPARDPLPFRWPMAFYLFAVLLSAFQAREPMATLFYAWQFARMFLVYAVVARVSAADDRFAPTLFTGMAIGLCLEAPLVVWQKFVLGIVQPPGTFSHQNSLGMALPFVVFPMFTFLLVGNSGLLSFAVPILGAGIAALIASRATIGLMAVGFVTLFALSALRRWTPRKMMIAFAGVVAVAGLVPLTLTSFSDRFDLTSNAAERSNLERAAHEVAAAAILENNPMGVGANNYSFVAGNEGYARQSRVVTDVLEIGAHVHNIYWLTAAEIGYLGLISFVLILLSPLVVAFLCCWQNRGDRRGDLLLGISISLFLVYVHSFYEWIFFTYPIQYLFALMVGITAGTAQRLGYWRRTEVRGRRRSGLITTLASEHRVNKSVKQL